MASKSLAALPLEKEAWVQNVPSKFQRPSLPTTQTSVAEIASTATASGVFGSTLHVVPLNCRTWLGTSFPPPPTAKMSVLETAEMPVNAPWADGAWTTLQLVPLKFSMSWPRPVPVPVLPTAQTSVEEMAVTALSVAAPPAIVGVVWMLQDVPLKNSTSGAAGAVSAHGPDGVLGQGAHARKRATADRRRGDHRPARAVEVLDQRTGRVATDGPDVGGRYRRDRAEVRPRDGRARHDLEAAREELARFELIESRGHRGLEPTGSSAFHWIALLVERNGALLGRWSDSLPRQQAAAA